MSHLVAVLCGEGWAGVCRRVDGMSEEWRGGVGQVVYCVGAAGGGEGFSNCSQPFRDGTKGAAITLTANA